MACATLKRSLDWESLNQRPAKRRRCGIFPSAGGSAQSPSTQPGTSKLTCEPTPSVFADATLTKLTPGTLTQSSINVVMEYWKTFWISIRNKKKKKIKQRKSNVFIVCFINSSISLNRKNGSKYSWGNYPFASAKTIEFHIQQLWENARLGIKRFGNGSR